MKKILSLILAAVPDKGFFFRTEMAEYRSDGLDYQMPEKQRMLFLAIAREGKASSITGGAFINRHRLNSASSISSAMKGLLEKDFITENKSIYSVYDQFFTLWLKFKGII